MPSRLEPGDEPHVGGFRRGVEVAADDDTGPRVPVAGYEQSVEGWWGDDVGDHGATVVVAGSGCQVQVNLMHVSDRPAAGD